MVSAGEKLALAVFASLLVLIISGLAFKDNLDARGHLKRAAEMENPVAPWKHATRWAPSGTQLLRSAIFVVNLANVIILIKFAYAIH